MYSMYIGVIGRSGGSTVNALAYRSGCTLTCPVTGEVFNHDSKSVQDVQLLLPKEAPQWAQDLQTLIAENRRAGIQEFCNLIEGSEGRKDSQLYREFRLSLPRDFSEEQSKALVNEYLKDQVNALGAGALTNYHFDVDEKTGESNPHCHVLVLTRGLTETGLGLKERSWNTKQHHEQWRSQWAAYGNYHLLKNGFEAHWDHRSYKDRGINFEPQPKLGSKIIKMEAEAGQNPKDIYSKPVTGRGREYQEVKLRNLYTLINRPEEALGALSKQHTTFMWGDVVKLLGRYVDDQALFERLSLKLQHSSELVCLEKKGSLHENVYTTRTRLAEEQQFVDRVNALKDVKSHGVEGSVVEGALGRAHDALKTSQKDPTASLSDDQVNAIKHMSLANQLSFVEGYAGAGKTTVMKVMKEIWESSGYQVFGLAPTGKAAENLADCGLSSDTVHSFLKSFDNGRSQYDSKTIIVLDEAGMVDHQRFHGLIQAVETLGIKLVASGDRGQLSPVEAGVPFRLAVAEAGKADLTTVLRQKVPWQKAATVLFGQGRAEEALKAYLDKGHIHFCEEKKPRDVVEQYNLSRRLAGNMGREIQRDIKVAQEKGEHLTFSSHTDYGLFLEWKTTRDACVKELYGHIETYRDQMRHLGVDGIDFAKKVLAHKGIESSMRDKYILAKELQVDWRDKPSPVCDPRSATKKHLVSAWFASTQDHANETQAMMAFSNKDVQELNGMARDLKRGAGDLGKEDYIYTIERNAGEELGRPQTVREERRFSVGDQIVFTKIDKGLGVNNGTLGCVTELSQSTIKVAIEKEGGSQEISFSPNLYKRFDNGWAVTIHKNQGATVDLAFVLASFEQYKNLAYVALTRHAKDVQVYASRFEFWRDEKLPDRLGHAQDKLSSLDYVSSDRALELLQSDEKLLGASLKRVGQKLEAVGYIGQRAFTQVCDKFFGKKPESGLIRVAPEVLSHLQSESDRAREKFEGIGTEGVAQGSRLSSQKSQLSDDFKEKSALYKDVSQTLLPYERKAVEWMQRAFIDYQDVLEDTLFEGLKPGETAQESKGTVTLQSVVLKSEGPLAGQWFDSQAQIKGKTLVDLYMAKQGCSVDSALYMVSFGLLPDKSSEILSDYTRSKAAYEDRLLKVEIAKHLKGMNVQDLVDKSVPLQGTPGETYLRTERGIQGELPGSLRYIPGGTVFTYGGESKKIYGGALASVATDPGGQVQGVQVTYLTPEGKRSLTKTGEKHVKMTYGSAKGAFVDLTPPSEKGLESHPLILSEGVETALSIKEAGIKGQIYCSLGISNMENLAVKDRDVIIAADWDGSTDKPSWSLTEKAKAALEDKGNRAHIILPVQDPKSVSEKIDFNDVLTKGGVDSVQSLLERQVPGSMLSLSLPRENQPEIQHDEKTVALPDHTKLAQAGQSEPSTNASQNKEPDQPLAQVDQKTLQETTLTENTAQPLFDWEGLRKKELSAHQYDLVIAHRTGNGKPSNAFKEEFALNPEQALHTVTLYDPSVIPILEKSHFESLMQPCLMDGVMDKEATLQRQYQLIIDYKNKVGKSLNTIESQFKERPEIAVRVQVALDKNIANMLDPHIPSEDALRFLDPPPVEKAFAPAVSLEADPARIESGIEKDSENDLDDSREKQKNQGLSL